VADYSFQKSEITNSFLYQVNYAAFKQIIPW